jgi:hypothetical protein
VYGVTTNGELQAKAPLTIRATGKFFGKSPMNATISTPLNSRTFKLKASGGMGRFDITQLNNFIPYADNVSIKSGTSTSSSFNITVVGRKCTGWVDPVYTNLDVELVTPEAKETNIFTDVASWAANTFVVKNDNPRGEDHVIGKVDYTLPQNAAIMQRLWFPIRDGIGDAAGF